MVGLLIFINWSVYAQNPYYIKAIEIDPYPENYTGVIVEDSTLVFHGVQFINGFSKRYVVKTTMLGDTIFTRTYFKDSLAYFDPGIDRSILKDDEGYLLCGREDLMLGYSQPVLMKIDENGDTLWSRSYPTDSLIGEYSGMVWARDSTVLCYGTKFTDTLGSRELLVVFHDKNGNQLWDTTYNIGVDEVGFSADTTSDGGFVLSGPVGANWDSFVLKLDSTGGQDWFKVYSHPGSEAGYIISASDSTFLLYGGVDRGNGGFESYAFKLDQNGDSLSSFYYPHVSSIEEFFSGTRCQGDKFALAGVTKRIGEPDPILLIVQLNKQGDMVWERRYKIRNTHHYPWAIRETSREGLIVAGYIFSDGAGNTQDGFLGHFSCLGYTELPSADFNWYNLGNNQVNLENTGGYADEYIWDFGDGWTYYHESNPQQISSYEPFVSHTYQSAGTYTVTLRAIACQDTTVSTQTITVDPMDVDELAGQSSLSVYPNPAMNQLTVDAATPSGERSTLALYSISGKLIKSSPIYSTLSKSVIDVSDLPSGMYVIQIEGVSGIEAVQKVIISGY